MLYEHRGKRPIVDPSAYVSPSAVLCGEVQIGAGCAVGFGAVLSAESGSIAVGRECVIMENVVIKASKRAPVKIGDHVLIGPRAYLTGCTDETCAFLATGVAIFNHAVIGARAEVRINGVVHLKTRLPADATVPIGWVAVGDPAAILPPDQHDRIWAIQEKLDFPQTIFGLARPEPGATVMPELTRRYAALLRAHAEDKAIG